LSQAGGRFREPTQGSRPADTPNARAARKRLEFGRNGGKSIFPKTQQVKFLN
jgi:hypothetical protein